MKPFTIRKCLVHKINDRHTWYIQVWLNDRIFADFRINCNSDFETEIEATNDLEKVLTIMEWNDIVEK